MTKYMVRKIDLNKVKTHEEYWEEMKKSEIKYCDGLDEVTQYCGGKLKRERCGYSGIINNIQYVAERCQ